MTLDFGLSRSLKIKSYGVIELTLYGFLLMVNSNIGLATATAATDVTTITADAAVATVPTAAAGTVPPINNL